MRIVGKCYQAAPRVKVVPFPNRDQELPKPIFADKLKAKRHCKRYKKRANKRKPYKKFRIFSESG